MRRISVVLLFLLLSLNAFSQLKHLQFLYIEVTPSDATLEINGAVKRMYDGVYEELVLLGSYNYRIYKDGYYEQSGVIEVSDPNNTTDRYFRLKKQALYGSLIITSKPSRSKVYIDGELIGDTPLYIPQIEAKSYDVTVEFENNNGEIARQAKTIEVKPDEETHVSYEDKDVLLYISSTPKYAVVYIDGDEVGTTPVTLRVRAGAHNIVISSNGYIDPERNTLLNITEDTRVYRQLQEYEAPSFMGGGKSAFAAWVNSRLVYPESAKKQGIQGCVTLRFTVEKDGSVTDIRVLSGVYPTLNEEAVRVVSMSPKWKPGIIKTTGEPVKVTYTFPVIFQLR